MLDELDYLVAMEGFFKEDVIQSITLITDRGQVFRSNTIPESDARPFKIDLRVEGTQNAIVAFGGTIGTRGGIRTINAFYADMKQIPDKQLFYYPYDPLVN